MTLMTPQSTPPKTNAQLADDLTIVASEVLMSMRYWQIIVDAEARLRQLPDPIPSLPPQAKPLQ